MPPVLYDAEDKDLLTLGAPGAYVRVIRPPGYITGIPTDACAIVGTASWGELNAPILVGTGDDAAVEFGARSAIGAADPHDLRCESDRAFLQAESDTSQQQYLLRIASEAALASFLALKDITAVTPKTLGKLTAICVGILGDQIKVYITAGAAANTFNVILTPPQPLAPEQFPGIKGGSAGVFAANLEKALRMGVDGFNGPSRLCRLTDVDATSLNPALLNGTPLAGGNDGRDVDASDFIGTQTDEDRTGIYALRELNPIPAVMWCAGLTDSSVTATLMAFKRQEGIICAINNPLGTDVATAVARRLSEGVDDPLAFYTKDHLYYYDSVIGKTLLVQPTPFIGGRIATLSAASSPFNKEVFGVTGTERTNSYGGNRKKYSSANIVQLRNNGIMVVQNPVPGGNFFGMPHGNAACTDQVRARLEWARMTNYLAHSVNAAMGPYAGLNQSQRVNDKLRALVKHALDEFLKNLVDLDQIDDFKVICDRSCNSFEMVARGYLRAKVYVRYMSSVQWLIVDLQGGSTVVTITNNPDDQPIAA